MKSSVTISSSVYYEIAMAIGNSFDLQPMLQQSIHAYLRELDCLAAIVFQVQRQCENDYAFNTIHVQQVNNDIDTVVDTYKNYSKDFTSSEEYLEWITLFPFSEATDNCFYANFVELPDFGFLILIREQVPLSREVMLMLYQVNTKLARATHACLQKRALELSELKYKRLSELLPEMICEVNLTGRVMYANGYALDKMGYSNEELAAGIYINHLFLPEDSEAIRQNFETSLHNEDIAPREYTVIRKNGESFSAILYTNRIIEDGEVKGLRGVLIDITERKRLEKEQKDNSERLEMALLASSAGLWDWNIKTDELIVNNQWYTIREYASGEIMPHLDSWKSLVHPDDLLSTLAALHQHIDGKTAIYQAEYRTKTKNGNYIWILSTGKITEYDSAGNASRMVGTNIDISEEKNNEYKLQQHIKQQELLSEIAILLNSTDNFDDKISEVIKKVGLHLQGSRIFINEDLEDGETTNNTFEWCNAGIKSLKKISQRIDYNTFPSWRQLLLEKNCIEANDINKLPLDIEKKLAKQSIFSILVFPIHISNRYAGYIGISQNDKIREWSRSEIELFRTVSGIIGNAFERRSVERSLRESEATNRAIVTALPDILLHFDKEGLLLGCNNWDNELFDKESSIISFEMQDLFSADIAEIFIEAIEMCLNDGAFMFEFKLSRSSNDFFYEARLSRINNDEVIVIVRDITKNKVYEADLKHALERAEQANQSKSEFLANMSHEIRTPMNAILGFSESLYHKESNEEHRKMLKSILASGNVLLSLINDILDMSKIEAGKLEIELQPVDIRHIVNEIVQIFSEKATKKNIGLVSTVNQTVPNLLILDEIRIRQVLLNIVGNAIKFTEQGQVIISVYFDLVDKGNGMLSITIEDTGIGIPDSQQDIIFEAFKQQSGQSTRKFGGTGLGLAISKKLVEKMNGQIFLTSTVDAGSCFSIIIDRVEISTAQRIFNFEEATDDVEIRFEPSTILIVDDVKTNITAIQNLIDSTDITFLEAENGEIALEILNHHKPDVILMDIKMPGMNGLEVTKIIKSQKKSATIPIIAFTASVFDYKKLNHRNIFDGILFKPVKRQLLIKELKKHLSYTLILDKDVPEINPKVFEQLSTEQKQQIPDLLSIIKQQHLNEWEIVKNKLLIFKIEEFVTHLNQTSDSFDIPLFKLYIDTLQEAIENFDLENIEQYLKDFPSLITQLEEIYNN